MLTLRLTKIELRIVQGSQRYSSRPTMDSETTRPLISLLLPTRARPDSALRFLESVATRTTAVGSVEVIMYIDDDDVGSHYLDHPAVRVIRVIGPRMSMGAYNSKCYSVSKGEIIILVNDDVIIRSQGWDETIRAVNAAAPDGVYLAYGNDLFKGERLSGFPILSRRTCELLVEPFPIAYKGAFIDVHLLDMFRRLQHFGVDRIYYLNDVVFEHLHYRTGKSAFDETYRNRDRFGDDSVFLGLIEARRNAAQRLYCVVTGSRPPSAVSFAPQKQKEWARFPSFVFGLYRDVLCDEGLSIPYRIRQCAWFISRWIASRVLGQLVARASPVK